MDEKMEERAELLTEEMTGQSSEIEALRERLLYAAGKYSDYCRYRRTISNTASEYDETLKLYHYEARSNKSFRTIRDKAAEMLQVTGEIFQDMSDNALRELYYVMCEIVKLDEAVQREICGVAIPEEHFTKEEFREMISEWKEYAYSQSETLEKYLQVLREWNWSEEKDSN